MSCIYYPQTITKWDENQGINCLNSYHTNYVDKQNAIEECLNLGNLCTGVDCPASGVGMAVHGRNEKMNCPPVR